jgi:Tfp pilus assembly protein PilO
VEKMKNRKDKDWPILVIIAIQLIAIFVVGSLIKQKTTTLVSQRHKLMVLEQKDESLVQLQEDYQLLKQDLEIISQALPGREKVVDFVTQLEREASASGLLTKISFGKETILAEAGGIKSVQFSLSFQGTYYQMIELIKKIEKMPQVITIDKISIRSAKGIEGKNSIVLVMRCYIDPEF